MENLEYIPVPRYWNSQENLGLVIKAMNHYEVGSKEYLLAKKIFDFFCERRAEEDKVIIQK